MLPEQGLLSDCANNHFHMNSCILAGSIQTTPKSKSGGHMTVSCGSQQERGQGILIPPPETSGRNSQGKGFMAEKPQVMQQSDLFRAEYVFVVDSDGEEEATSRKGEQAAPGDHAAARPKSLAISSSLMSDVVRPKIRGVDLKASSHPEIPHGMTPQQKHGQLTSSTTSEQFACKAPAFSFVSPTNLNMPPVPANFKDASVLQEFHSRRLDASGALLEEAATYFQTASHSSPCTASKGASTLPFSSCTRLPGSNLSASHASDQAPGLASEAQKTTLTSHVLSAREHSRTSSSPPSSVSPKSHSASYIPVRIVMHSLSPSPKPFTSSVHGSLSTVCSPMSSSGNLSKSGVKSPVPSRLSLLTAILKSHPSHQRPLSPASCPTFSLNSLASSTLTLDQKVRQTPSTPKKSLSSGSLGDLSPEQGELQTSEVAQQSCHLPFLTKSTPLSQVYSLPPASGGSGLVPCSADKTPSPPSKSATVLPQLQANASSPEDAPPIASSLTPRSFSKGRLSGDLSSPAKPRETYKHPSVLGFPASSSTSPPANESTTPSPTEKCFRPSPALSNLIDRSNRPASLQHSAHVPGPSALPSPSVSSTSSAPLSNLGASILPPANLPTQGVQRSALQSHAGSGTFPSTTGKSESTMSNHRPPVSTLSLPVSLTRTKELISPCTLSTGPENKKPKTSTTLPKAAGRETKYANLSSPSSTVSETQLTKPGVIRPVPVKSKHLMKMEEEVYEPNPFSKYLEDNGDLFSDQDVGIPHKPVSLHPLYQTKLHPPAKSLLHPLTLAHADCLTPGPFSHLSFSLRDEQKNCPTLLSQNICNKQ